jgi:hypothetical protein
VTAPPRLLTISPLTFMRQHACGSILPLGAWGAREPHRSISAARPIVYGPKLYFGTRGLEVQILSPRPIISMKYIVGFGSASVMPQTKLRVRERLKRRRFWRLGTQSGHLIGDALHACELRKDVEVCVSGK